MNKADTTAGKRMARPVPRPGVVQIDPYVPGEGTTADPDEVHKLSANESALGASPKAIEAARVAAQNMHLYPDGNATTLRAELAQLHGLERDQLICGAGSDELIMLLCRCYLGPGDTIVQTRHGFSMYHIYARACGAETIFAEERDLTADVEAILAAVTDTTRLVFLANPNNPTGTVISADEVARLRTSLRSDIILVLDAAYAEFMNEVDYDDGRALVRASVESGCENVVMLRTFSKIYGLGGLRLGWGYFPPSIAEVINKVRSPFNVSAPALAAGFAAAKDQAFIEKNRHFTLAERKRLEEAVRGFQLSIRPTHTNFLLIRMKDEETASALVSYMVGQNIMIRAMGGYFLPDHVRVSVGQREANDAFLKALENFMAGTRV